MIRETITFAGHPNIKAIHSATIEFTKDAQLTKKGDCIIGVGASGACCDLSGEAKRLLKTDGMKVRIVITVGDFEFRTFGFGSSNLTLDDEHDIVIRKSEFKCPRTLCIMSSYAAKDIPRTMVQALRKPDATGMLSLDWNNEAVGYG